MFGLFKNKKHEEDDADALPPREPAEPLRAVLPREERVSSYKEAHITTDTGYKVRGIVVDHSPSGLRIRFQSYETLPEIVQLRVPGLSIKGMGRIVWQDHSDFGVEMIG
jgi:hypothetical protein